MTISKDLGVFARASDQLNSYGFLRNRIINGGMGIDQRNAGANQTITAAAALAYTVDRWYAYCTGANVTGARVASTGTTGSPSQYAYQFTGAASVTAIGFGQRIEAVNSFDLAGSTATLSVNLSNSLLTTVTWIAYYATTADTFGSLATPTRTQIATGTFTVTSTLTRYSTNITVPSAATTGIEVVFSVGSQTSGTWVIGTAQLEAGSTATPFERRHYQQELSMCQRYYEKSYDPETVAGTATNIGATSNSTNASGYIIVTSFFAAVKRITPIVTIYSTATGASGRIRNISSNVDLAATTYIGLSSFYISYGVTNGNNYCIYQWVAVAEL